MHVPWNVTTHGKRGVAGVAVQGLAASRRVGRNLIPAARGHEPFRALAGALCPAWLMSRNLPSSRSTLSQTVVLTGCSICCITITKLFCLVIL